MITAKPSQAVEEVRPEEMLPPEVSEEEPELGQEASPFESGVNFWPELVAAVRQELKPPAVGFFVSGENSPIKGVIKDQKLELRCRNSFTAQMIGKEEVLEVVARKISAMLGRPTKVVAVDMSAKPTGNSGMESLVRFGQSHSDIIHLKD